MAKTSKQTNANKRACLNIERCIHAEELVRDNFVMYYESNGARNRTCVMDLAGLLSLCKEDYEDAGRDDETKQEWCHILLAQLTRGILSKEEFVLRYEAHPFLDEFWREKVWWHNTHCSVTFVHTYTELIDCITLIIDPELAFVKRVSLAKHIRNVINLMEEIRKDFPFCSECRFNEETCEFWIPVSSHLEGLITLHDQKKSDEEIKTFFQDLTIRCKIPKSFEELKQQFQEKGIRQECLK